MSTQSDKTGEGSGVQRRLLAHQAALAACRRCPRVAGTPVQGLPVASRILLIGQAPGPREEALGRPFAWTAGKTLFAWFAGLGVDETRFREGAYIAAVCRCFPGRQPRGGDRVPDRAEVAACAAWLADEVALLEPALVIPVGKLAIAQVLGEMRLDAAIGRRHRVDYHGRTLDVVPLPHPSGASTWHRTEPGKTLLAQALRLLGAHHAWRSAFAEPPAPR